jgi:hypothetical protein
VIETSRSSLPRTSISVIDGGLIYDAAKADAVTGAAAPATPFTQAGTVLPR